MSGVFSMAAHSALQYLPDVITHEQTGCAHLWPFSVAISFLLDSDQRHPYSYRFTGSSPTGKNDGHTHMQVGDHGVTYARCPGGAKLLPHSQFWNRKMLDNSYVAKIARNATSRASPRTIRLRARLFDPWTLLVDE
jgi:hypothetical protein